MAKKEKTLNFELTPIQEQTQKTLKEKFGQDLVKPLPALIKAGLSEKSLEKIFNNYKNALALYGLNVKVSRVIAGAKYQKGEEHLAIRDFREHLTKLEEKKWSEKSEKKSEKEIKLQVIKDLEASGVAKELIEIVRKKAGI